MINKKMSEVTVHVTCDISKRIISCTRHNLLSKIKEEFGITRDMILQVYDNSWDDWIDIEPLSVKNRSKLKVVMPKIPPKKIKKECNDIKDELIKSTSTEKACSTLKYVSEGHWKSPYQMPKLSVSMEEKLSAQKQLNITEKRSLVDQLYEDIVTYTRFPRSSHYHDIATALLTKYPYLSRQANVYETKRHWINLLRKRFKERRSSQDTDEIQTPETSTNGYEGNNDSDKETIIYGDYSEVSEVKEDPEKMRNSKYISWMKFEFKKRIQDRDKVARFMDLTFAERRNFVIHSTPRVSVIKEIYPFLFHEDEVKKEYERISGQRLETTFLENLRKHCRRILNLTPDSSPLKQMTLKCMAEAISEKERKHAIGAGALFMLPELLKEELEDFMHFYNTSEKKKDFYPRIESSCTIEEVIRGRGSFKVFVENILLCEPLELVQAFESLSSSYFIFNIAYPEKCLGTFETLQILFLQLVEDKDISRKAARVIVKLESK